MSLKVAASVTVKLPLTVVAEPLVDNVGVVVAHVTTSVKLVFIWEATILAPAVKLFVTDRAPINVIS